ncbi:deoxyribose-phosphate aldolase [Fopius arisanus]|uniref:deoxyribose-phosphate aldolase n=1 Tax=Fopius arisanus TaxID=64838 RepID=A0A0C9PS68_9HYME|nr:PREDICTED: deoxyribose-phosphate aldolase [Fopius arisanus]
MQRPVIESSILTLNVPSHVTHEYVRKRVSEIQSICGSIDNRIVYNRSQLLKAISLIDLTSLNVNDSSKTIEELCARAINPIGEQIGNKDLHTAAVCIFQARAQDAIDFLKQRNIQDISVATVAGDFPNASLPYDQRLKDVLVAGQSDVDEIDIVIDRCLVKNDNWEELFKQISEMRRVCAEKHMKTILSTGDLPSINHIYKASMVAMSAGSDFIKTSTGKESINATLEVGVVMCEAIKEFQRLTGRKVGLKPAGGIKTALQAIEWLTLVEKILGDDWINKDLFRIGASSLLDDLVQTINDS